MRSCSYAKLLQGKGIIATPRAIGRNALWATGAHKAVTYQVHALGGANAPRVPQA